MPSDPDLRALIQQRLCTFTVQAATSDQHTGRHHAAVTVAICEAGRGAELPGLPQQQIWSTQSALILTRRADHMRRHAGQWALPGGRMDAGETPERTALRELAEEVALELDDSTILGRLDDVITRSGFIITPVVVWAGAAKQMQPNPTEVASLHRIPVTEFMRTDAPMLAREGDGEHPVLRMPVGSSWIAAPTAAILYQFREVCLENRATRVAHFEQPAFAWK